jgi:hypothetical protein
MDLLDRTDRMDRMDTMDLSHIVVQDPFAPPALENGEGVKWVIRDIENPSESLSEPMSHYEAMRVDIQAREYVVSREDQVGDILVHGFGHDDRWLTQPTSIDITPALAQMSMQDFVDMQAENFEDGSATRKVLDILEEQGDPRTGRLRMYEKEWSSVDEDGNRAKACLDIDKDSLMAWCEVNRLDIHDELTDRERPYVPSI